MSQAKHKRKSKPIIGRRKHHHGLPPGTITADPSASRSLLSVIAYSKEKFIEKTSATLQQLTQLRSEYDFLWINVDGLADVELIQSLGTMFNLHKLALEDTVNVHQRPKVEPYINHLFIVCRTLNLHERCETEQLSLFLGKNFVISFQEHPGDCFDSVRHRIRNDKSKIREHGADYLCYALLDAIIDSFFPILENYGEKAELIEETTLSSNDPQNVVSQINLLRRDLLTMRRSIWPMREAINTIIREPNLWVGEETKVYLRDCYDHCVQIIDNVETLRELGSGLMDVALSSMNHRLNETMRVLTVISTVFIPLNFIASIYGMNFDTKISPWNMPELEWAFGYPFALALMGAMAFAQILFFYKRGWMSPPEKRVIGSSDS